MAGGNSISGRPMGAIFSRPTELAFEFRERRRSASVGRGDRCRAFRSPPRPQRVAPPALRGVRARHSTLCVEGSTQRGQGATFNIVRRRRECGITLVATAREVERGRFVRFGKSDEAKLAVNARRKSRAFQAGAALSYQSRPLAFAWRTGPLGPISYTGLPHLGRSRPFTLPSVAGDRFERVQRIVGRQIAGHSQGLRRHGITPFQSISCATVKSMARTSRGSGSRLRYSMEWVRHTTRPGGRLFPTC